MNIFKFIIILLYFISWFLPIGHEHYIGYQGANFAFEIFSEGFEEIYALFFGTKTLTLKSIFIICKIVYGSVNIVFILAYLLLLFKNKYSVALSGVALVIMLYWGYSFNTYYGYGYSLWLLSCLLLFLFSIKNTFGKNISKMYRSKLLVPSYIVTLVLGGMVYLDYATR
jgi:hypothetical protein